jgi:hypothetical protein
MLGQALYKSSNDFFFKLTLVILVMACPGLLGSGQDGVWQQESSGSATIEHSGGNAVGSYTGHLQTNKQNKHDVPVSSRNYGTFFQLVTHSWTQKTSYFTPRFASECLLSVSHEQQLNGLLTMLK